MKNKLTVPFSASCILIIVLLGKVFNMSQISYPSLSIRNMAEEANHLGHVKDFYKFVRLPPEQSARAFRMPVGNFKASQSENGWVIKERIVHEKQILNNDDGTESYFLFCSTPYEDAYVQVTFDCFINVSAGQSFRSANWAVLSN